MPSRRRRLISDVAAPADALTRLVAHGDQQFEAFFERVESVELLPKGAPQPRPPEEGTGTRGQEDRERPEPSGGRRHDLGTCLRRLLRPRGGNDPGRSVRRRRASGPVDGRRCALAEIEQAESRLTRAVNRRRVGFPMEITARRHRRQVQVIRSRVAAPPQFEEYFSLQVTTPWGVWGGLLPSLAAEDLDPVALCLVDRLRSRSLPPRAARSRRHRPRAQRRRGPAPRSGRPRAGSGHPGPLRLSGPGCRAETRRPRTRCGRRSAFRAAGLQALERRRGHGGDQPLVASDAVGSGNPLADPCLGRALPQHGPRAPAAGRAGIGCLDRAPPTSNCSPAPFPRGELFAEAVGGLYIGEFERGNLDPFDGRCVLRAPCGPANRRDRPERPHGTGRDPVAGRRSSRGGRRGRGTVRSRAAPVGAQRTAHCCPYGPAARRFVSKAWRWQIEVRSAARHAKPQAGVGRGAGTHRGTRRRTLRQGRQHPPDRDRSLDDAPAGRPGRPGHPGVHPGRAGGGRCAPGGANRALFLADSGPPPGAERLEAGQPALAAARHPQAAFAILRNVARDGDVSGCRPGRTRAGRRRNGRPGTPAWRPSAPRRANARSPCHPRPARYRSQRRRARQHDRRHRTDPALRLATVELDFAASRDGRQGTLQALPRSLEPPDAQRRLHRERDRGTPDPGDGSRSTVPAGRRGRGVPLRSVAICWRYSRLCCRGATAGGGFGNSAPAAGSGRPNCRSWTTAPSTGAG